MMIVAVLLWTSAFSDAGVAPAKVPNAYFRVTPPDGGEDSYLLGTAHGPVGLDEFAGDVEKQIGKSKVVRVERVMTSTDLDAYAKDPITALAKLAVFRGSPVDEATRRKLVEYGIPPAVAARLSDQDCGALGVIGQAQGLPLDLSVLRAGYRAKVNVRSIDTDDARIKARDQENAAEGGACSLKNIFSQYAVADLRAQFLEEARSTIEDYRAGKLDDEDDLNSPLVVSRNLAWMPTLLGDLKQGGAFVAVGQNHLFGLNGLISLLRRRGYKVTEVNGADAAVPVAITAGPAVAR